MAFFWKDVQCSTQVFKYIGRVNDSGQDCVPTAIAMLVWNLGYGLGLESLATRTAVYAQRASPDENVRSKTKKENYCVIGLWAKMVYGCHVAETSYILDSYGLGYDTYLNSDYDHNKEAKGIAKTVQELANIINNLKDGEGALIGGSTERGSGHGIAVLRRKHVLVALDRIESAICWAHVANGQSLAYVEGNDIEIRGNGVGKVKKEYKKNKSQSLSDVEAVFVIRNQGILKTLGKAFGSWLSTTHQYFY